MSPSCNSAQSGRKSADSTFHGNPLEKCIKVQSENTCQEKILVKESLGYNTMGTTEDQKHFLFHVDLRVLV